MYEINCINHNNQFRSEGKNGSPSIWHFHQLVSEPTVRRIGSVVILKIRCSCIRFDLCHNVCMLLSRITCVNLFQFYSFCFFFELARNKRPISLDLFFVVKIFAFFDYFLCKLMMDFEKSRRTKNETKNGGMTCCGASHTRASGGSRLGHRAFPFLFFMIVKLQG